MSHTRLAWSIWRMRREDEKSLRERRGDNIQRLSGRLYLHGSDSTSSSGERPEEREEKERELEESMKVEKNKRSLKEVGLIQEWDLVDQEQRTDDGTEDAAQGSRTEGKLPEFPVQGYPEGYLLQDGRPFPRVPPLPPPIGHIEGVAPLPQGDLQPGPTPTGTYGLPNWRLRRARHHKLGSSEGPFSSISGTSGTAEKASSSEATVKGTMSLTVSMPGREETTTATLEGSLTLEAPEKEKAKKSKNKKVEKNVATLGEEKSAASEELDEEKSRLKQRILTAGKIAPKATSSSSSSKEMSKAEMEERERQAMRVACEESGEVVGQSRATSSMEMTAMDFRAIVASDEARAFRQEAARQRIRDQEISSMVNREIQVPKATSKASLSTRGEEEGQRQSEVPRSGSSGDQVQGTTSLPSSSTGMAAGETLMHPDREGLDGENDRTLEDQRKIPENPWNAFQQANRGRGWSQKKMQEEYWSQKGRGKGYKSGKP